MKFLKINNIDKIKIIKKQLHDKIQKPLRGIFMVLGRCKDFPKKRYYTQIRAQKSYDGIFEEIAISRKFKNELSFRIITYGIS